MSDNIVKQLSCIGMLHYQIEFSLSLDDLIQLYHVWMPHSLQNLYFSRYPVHISLILDFALLQDLDGHSLVSDCLYSELDLAECPFAQGLLNPEVRNLFQLPLAASDSCSFRSRRLRKYELLQRCLCLLEFFRSLLLWSFLLSVWRTQRYCIFQHLIFTNLTNNNYW